MFVLVIMMQIALPIRVVGSLATTMDLGYLGTICSSTPTEANGGEGGDRDHSNTVCAACEIAGSTQVASTPTAVIVLQPMVTGPGPNDRDPGYATRPRAPPRPLPPARAPPPLA